MPNPDKSFVQALYHTAIGRDATQAELDQWAAQIPTLGREGVARAINHLPEAFDHVITVDYQTYLHEPPPDADEARLEKLFEQGATQEEVLADILGSDAFFQQATKRSGGRARIRRRALHRSAVPGPAGLPGGPAQRQGAAPLAARAKGRGPQRRGPGPAHLGGVPDAAITAYFSTILHETQPPSPARWTSSRTPTRTCWRSRSNWRAAEFYRNGGQ